MTAGQVINSQKAMSTFQDVAQKYLPHLFALNTLGQAVSHGGWTQTYFLASKSQGRGN